MIPPSAKPSRSSSFTFSQGMYVTPRSTSQNCLYSCFTPLFRAHAIWIKDAQKVKITDYYYCFLIVASCNIQPCAPKSKASPCRTNKEHNGINCIGNVDLDDFGANLKRASAELLTGTVCILPVDHTDVGTTSGRDHLQRDTRTGEVKESKRV